MTAPRTKQYIYDEPFEADLDHAALTASLTRILDKVPAGQTLRIDRAFYVNDVGLATDNANDFSLVLKNGATVVATIFNTDGNDVPAGAALVAGTEVDAVFPVAANAVLAGGTKLTAVFTLEGTQTLPPGRLRVVGRWL